MNAVSVGQACGLESSIKVRAYLPGDELGLIRLYERCFGRVTTLAYWKWITRNDEAACNLVWVAERDGHIVGQYQGTPLRARVRGTTHPVIMIADVMVDPDCRRQGVLLQMGQAAHAHWCEAGFYLGYGLPNEQWGSRAASLGWMPLFELHWYRRILRPERMLARRLRVPLVRRFTVIGALYRFVTSRSRSRRYIEISSDQSLDAAWDEISRRSENHGNIEIQKGGAWVRKRYLDCPTKDYHVLTAFDAHGAVGYVAYHVHGNAVARLATIAEITHVPGRADAIEVLCKAVERHCLEDGVEVIRVVMPPQSTITQGLESVGYRHGNGAFTFKFVPFSDAAREQGSKTRWGLQGGDFDVV